MGGYIRHNLVVEVATKFSKPINWFEWRSTTNSSRFLVHSNQPNNVLASSGVCVPGELLSCLLGFFRTIHIGPLTLDFKSSVFVLLLAPNSFDHFLGDSL